MRKREFPFELLTIAGLWLVSSTTILAEGRSVFVDVAAESGIDFVHFNGMTGEMYFPEMAGQGVALLDFDGDGDLDVYLVQGKLLGDEVMADALYPAAKPPVDQLFRNDLDPTDPSRLTFVDVTSDAGLSEPANGMGVATGDVDNDGDVDLYILNQGANQLLLNLGDGRFEDVAKRAGVDDPSWSVSATFVDLDGDSDLDLYVANYVEFSVTSRVTCFATSSRRDYCGPSAYPPVSDRLYRNHGDGVFEDISESSGIGRLRAPGLGVVAADFDGDGWQDLYVANDGEANFLWLNQRNGTLRDEALLAGVAVNRMGEPEASMGVTVADLDDDGDQDLFMTHLAGESNTLFINEGGALFEDRTAEYGLASTSHPWTSFGTKFVDFDSDSWLDLIVASGAVKILEPLAREGDLFPLDQPNQLFRNRRGDGGRGFADISVGAGGQLETAEVSRGLAIGDLDNDGDPDVVIANNNGPARVLKNLQSPGDDWLGLRLVQQAGRDAFGAVAELQLDDGRTLSRRVATDGSYASASDPRVIFGFRGKQVKSLEVRWPTGRTEVLDPAPLRGRYTTIRSTADAMAEETSGKSSE